MSGRIILCADDYALTAGVSQAIRMLAAAARISATSAIVTQPGWPRDAAALKPLAEGLAIGLHLNFTLGRPRLAGSRFAQRGEFPGLKRLITMAKTGRLDHSQVAAEIEAQLDAFEAGVGAAPDFIDGHEHVHILPVIRPALLRVAQRRYGGRGLLIRDPSRTFLGRSPSSRLRAKGLALRYLGFSMGRDIRAAGFVSNDRFGGVTQFDASNERVVLEFRAASDIDGWRPLVMCHPGFADAELRGIDRIADRRQTEFEVLMRPTPPMGQIWHPARRADGTVDWPGPANGGNA